MDMGTHVCAKVPLLYIVYVISRSMHTCVVTYINVFANTITIGVRDIYQLSLNR